VIIRIPWKAMVALLLLLSVAAGGLAYYNRFIRVDPEELMFRAIEGAKGTASYRYRVFFQVVTNGNKIVMSNIRGERTEAGEFHITGEIQAQKTEVFHIANTTYMRDAITGKWMVIPGSAIGDHALFMVEVHPLATLYMTAWDNLTYLGKEVVDGKKLLVLTSNPVIDNQFLNTWFTGFQSKLWVDRTGRIYRSQLQGVYKSDSKHTFFLEMEIWDQNQNIKLNPPSV